MTWQSFHLGNKRHIAVSYTHLMFHLFLALLSLKLSPYLKYRIFGFHVVLVMKHRKMYGRCLFFVERYSKEMNSCHTSLQETKPGFRMLHQRVNIHGMASPSFIIWTKTIQAGILNSKDDGYCYLGPKRIACCWPSALWSHNKCWHILQNLKKKLQWVIQNHRKSLLSRGILFLHDNVWLCLLYTSRCV